MPNTRHTQRQGMDLDVRVRLLESDLDQVELVGERLDARLEALQRVGWGIMSSLVVASLLLAANLVVGL